MRRSNRRALGRLRPAARVVALIATATLSTGIVGSPAHADEIPLDAPPRLRSLASGSESASCRPLGLDPSSPRELVLWLERRSPSENHQRIGTTRSTPDGRFDFGEVPLPPGERALQVTPEGAAPDPNRWRRAPRDLAPPQVQWILGARSRNELLLRPERFVGSVRIFDAATGQLRWQRPLETTAENWDEAMQRGHNGFVVDLEIALSGRVPPSIRIDQIDDRGRATDSMTLETRVPGR